jgi:hypothetical protein
MPTLNSELKNKTTHLNTFIYSTTTKIIENLFDSIQKKQKKNSLQDGCQMIKMKFNSCKIIPHYCSNIFALQYAHIHNFCLDFKHT